MRSIEEVVDAVSTALFLSSVAAVASVALFLSCSSPTEPVATLIPEEAPAFQADASSEDGGPSDVGAEDTVEDTPPPAAVEEPESEANAPEADAPEAVSVADIVDQRPPYRNARYVRRCRVESRRVAPEAETLEGRDDARGRARDLARRDRLDPVLILARMVYGETGTPNPGHNDDPATPLWDEAEAILAVIDQRRGRMKRVEMMVNYAPRRVFPRPDDERQRWIAELQLDGSRPASWPRPPGRRHHAHPPWRQYGCPRWLATVDAVRRVLRAHPRHAGAATCEEVPDHWGGTMDRHGFERGWRRVTCARGFTRNLFWAVPSRDEDASEREE